MNQGFIEEWEKRGKKQCKHHQMKAYMSPAARKSFMRRISTLDWAERSDCTRFALSDSAVAGAAALSDS